MSSNDTTVPHDPNAKIAGAPLAMPDKVADTIQSAPMSFKPIGQIKQALCALHPYAHDPTRMVPAFHFCSHSVGADLHQCLIYDSNEPSARLIGVEYIIPERIFNTLDEKEKRYWHSHKCEIESGVLTIVAKASIPGPVVDALEMPALQDLHSTYGKTWHFWQIDRGDKLPLGLPTLMKAFNDLSEVSAYHIEAHEARTGTSVETKRNYRSDKLDLGYQVAVGADEKGPHLELMCKGDNPNL